MKYEKQSYKSWVDCVVLLEKSGWHNKHGWLFYSPNTGNLHDLSCADLKQLKRIEEEGLFLVAE